MKGRAIAVGGAVLAAAGAVAPWSTISIEPIAGLRGESAEATGISSGAGGWALFVLTATVVILTLVLASGAAPAAPRLVAWGAGAALAWGAVRVFSLVGRVSELDDPAFNVQASLSWGPWIYLAGCALVLIGAAWVGLLQSRRRNDDEGEEQWR